MSDNPNPQGKGQVPVLAALSAQREAVAGAAPKQIDQISRELFTSLFVLGSDFNFQPVVGKPYFLYRKEGRFRLSPLSPADWQDDRISGRFIGECELQPDLTWTLNLAPEVADDEAFLAFLANEHETLRERMMASPTLEEALPGYRHRSRFYQRVLSFGLSQSLRASMSRSGIAALSYDEARGLLGPVSEGEEE